MKVKQLLIISIVMLLLTTVLGSVKASTTISGLPMPYGSGNLTNQHMPLNVSDYDNLSGLGGAFYGVRVSNNQNYIGWMYLIEDWSGIHAC